MTEHENELHKIRINLDPADAAALADAASQKPETIESLRRQRDIYRKQWEFLQDCLDRVGVEIAEAQRLVASLREAGDGKD